MKKGITLIAVLGIVLAVTSGAFAANHYLITSSSQIKDGVISLADLSPAARTALQGKPGSTVDAGLQKLGGAQGLKGDQGETGPQGSQGDTGAAGTPGKDGTPGPKGDTGAQGPKGQAGVSGYEVRTWRYSKVDADSDAGPGYSGVGGGAIATVACSPGKVAIGGGYRFTENGFDSPAVSDGSGVVASFPGRMDWSTNTVKPNDNSGWIVQVNDKVSAADMTLYVICVNAS